MPLGVIYKARQATATVTNSTVTQNVTLTGVAVKLTAGRTYRVTHTGNAQQATSGTGTVDLYVNTANVVVGSAAAGTRITHHPIPFLTGSAITAFCYTIYLTVGPSGDFAAGTYYFLGAASSGVAGNVLTVYGTGTSLYQAQTIIVEDAGGR